MRTGARKGALGRPALVVGVGVVVLCSGQLAGAAETVALDLLEDFVVQTDDRATLVGGSSADAAGVASSQRASRQSQLQPGRLAWTNEDALTVPSHLVDVLMGREDTPDVSGSRTWATIWIVQRWTFEPLLSISGTSKASCTYCSSAIAEVIPLAFPYRPTLISADPGIAARGPAYPRIDAGAGSMAAPEMSFERRNLPTAGSTRQRAHGTPPLPFYAAVSGSTVGSYPRRGPYSDAPGTSDDQYGVDPDIVTNTAIQPLPDPGRSAVDPEPYTQCPGVAWAGFGCASAGSDAYPQTIEDVSATLETASTGRPTRAVPEPGTLGLLGLGLLALGLSSFQPTRHGRAAAP